MVVPVFVIVIVIAINAAMTMAIVMAMVIVIVVVVVIVAVVVVVCFAHMPYLDLGCGILENFLLWEGSKNCKSSGFALHCLSHGFAS